MMLKLTFVAFAASLILLASPASAQTVGPPTIACNTAVIVPAGTAGPVTIIPAVTGKRILICGWNLTDAGATASFFTLLTAGGTNCATTPTALTPAMAIGTVAGSNIDHTPYASMQTPVGEKLCITVTGTAADVTGLIYYTQF